MTLPERQYKAYLGRIVATSTQHCGKYNDSDKTEALCQFHDKSLSFIKADTIECNYNNQIATKQHG